MRQMKLGRALVLRTVHGQQFCAWISLALRFSNCLRTSAGLYWLSILVPSDLILLNDPH